MYVIYITLRLIKAITFYKSPKILLKDNKFSNIK